MQFNISKDLLGALRGSGIEGTLERETLEFLQNNSPREYAIGWGVESNLSDAGISLQVTHDFIGDKELDIMEFGLGEDDVVFATMRQLQIMMEERFPELILEAML